MCLHGVDRENFSSYHYEDYKRHSDDLVRNGPMVIIDFLFNNTVPTAYFTQF
jgi:hypothetical protein